MPNWAQLTLLFAVPVLAAWCVWLTLAVHQLRHVQHLTDVTLGNRRGRRARTPSLVVDDHKSHAKPGEPATEWDSTTTQQPDTV